MIYSRRGIRPRETRMVFADYEYLLRSAIVRSAIDVQLRGRVLCNRAAFIVNRIHDNTRVHARGRRPEMHRSRRIRDIVNSNCLHARVAYCREICTICCACTLQK